MRKIYRSLIDLVRDYLGESEDQNTADLIKHLKPARRRGYITKNELLDVGKWKSAMAIPLLKKNSAASVINITRKAFETSYEKRKTDLLCTLHGVAIPMASSILMLTDPKNYGVIDIRVWQVLYLYGAVSKNPTGRSLSFNNWYSCLVQFRYLAKKLGVSVRDVERAIFEHHKEIQQGKLYK